MAVSRLLALFLGLATTDSIWIQCGLVKCSVRSGTAEIAVLHLHLMQNGLKHLTGRKISSPRYLVAETLIRAQSYLQSLLLPVAVNGEQTMTLWQVALLWSGMQTGWHLCIAQVMTGLLQTSAHQRSTLELQVSLYLQITWLHMALA